MVKKRVSPLHPSAL